LAIIHAMAQKTRSVIAVELSPAFLKLVEILPDEKRIAAVAIEPLDRARWEKDDYLAEQIKTAIARHCQAHDAELITAVSGNHAILRFIEVPEGEQNILDAVQWDMEQYLARPLYEYLMDYQEVGGNATKNGTVYLVAAYRRRQVERIQGIMESCGLTLAVLDVDIFAALNALEANYPGMAVGKTLLIKADVSALLCIRAQDGMFAGCESIPIESDVFDLDASARADRFLDLARQIRLHFENTARTWGTIDHAVLCGDLAAQETFREAMEDNLSTPLICLDAFKEMSFVPGTDANAAFMPGAAQCAGALGLALRRAGDC